MLILNATSGIRAERSDPPRASQTVRRRRRQRFPLRAANTCEINVRLSALEIVSLLGFKAAAVAGATTSFSRAFSRASLS